jgi:hypothetical protein
MTEFTLTLGASFGVGMLGVLLLRHLPTLSLQLTGLSLLAVALPLVTVLVSGLVMFQMHADLKVLALACGAAASVLICAFALTRSIGRRVNEHPTRRPAALPGRPRRPGNNPRACRASRACQGFQRDGVKHPIGFSLPVATKAYSIV